MKLSWYFRKRAVSATAGVMLAVAALVISGPSAIASPVQAVRTHYNLIFPGINHWFPKEQPPPKETLLRFYMLEHTNTTPRAFRGVLCLHKFRFRREKQERVFPCAKVTLADLASPRDSVTWHIGETPYSTWNCARGWYFVSFSVHGVSSTGRPQHAIRYSPYRPGTRIKVDGDWGSSPPTRRESHFQANCKQVR